MQGTSAKRHVSRLICILIVFILHSNPKGNPYCTFYASDNQTGNSQKPMGVDSNLTWEEKRKLPVAGSQRRSATAPIANAVERLTRPKEETSEMGHLKPLLRLPGRWSFERSGRELLRNNLHQYALTLAKESIVAYPKHDPPG